jgi:hypothetical protein
LGGYFLKTCGVLLYKLGYVISNGTIINASPKIQFGALELKTHSSHERICGAISDIENPKAKSDNDTEQRFQKLLRRVSVRRDKKSELSSNLVQHLKLCFLGQAYIGYRIRPGWKASLPFYAFECQRHGVIVNYPHGYGQRLECLLCQNEEDFLRSFLVLEVGDVKKEESDVASLTGVAR